MLQEDGSISFYHFVHGMSTYYLHTMHKYQVDYIENNSLGNERYYLVKNIKCCVSYVPVKLGWGDKGVVFKFLLNDHNFVHINQPPSKPFPYVIQIVIQDSGFLLSMFLYYLLYKIIILVLARC